MHITDLIISPNYSLAALKVEIDNRCYQYYDIIAGRRTSIDDPEMVRALSCLADAYKLKNALSSIEDRYSDFMKDLTEEVKIIASQIDHL